MKIPSRKGTEMYNATAYSYDVDGKLVSTQAVEVDSDGFVIRAGGYWTHTIGTAAYDADWRGSKFSNVDHIEVEVDGGAGFRAKLAGLALPPAYRDAEVER
jgi:hypothetical protein